MACQIQITQLKQLYSPTPKKKAGGRRRVEMASMGDNCRFSSLGSLTMFVYLQHNWVINQHGYFCHCLITQCKRAEVIAYKFTQLLAGRRHLENNSVTWVFISLKDLFFEEHSTHHRPPHQTKGAPILLQNLPRLKQSTISSPCASGGMQRFSQQEVTHRHHMNI